MKFHFSRISLHKKQTNNNKTTTDKQCSVLNVLGTCLPRGNRCFLIVKSSLHQNSFKRSQCCITLVVVLITSSLCKNSCTRNLCCVKSCVCGCHVFTTSKHVCTKSVFNSLPIARSFPGHETGNVSLMLFC